MRHSNLDCAGTTKCQIHAADFVSVVVYQNDVYAASADDSTIYVFKYDGVQWEKVRSFGVDLGGIVSLSVRNDQIKCCSVMYETTNVYSLTGELLDCKDTCRHADNRLNGCPFICDDSDDASLLLVDVSCGRVQVMNEQGELCVLSLEPPVSQPRSALLYSNHLYVTSLDTNCIYTYDVNA